MSEPRKDIPVVTRGNTGPEPERRPFADLDARWEDWYRRTHAHNDPEMPHVKLGIEPTVEGLEKEIWVKAHLLTDGVRFAKTALEGVSEIYREQSRWLFDWNHGEHHHYLPEELVLPMDTIIQVRENKDSRWECIVEDGVLMLKRDGKMVTEARHIPRPGYYGKEASEGIIMRRVAPKRGQDCLVLNYSPFCMYWVNDEGCDFCNIVPTMNWNKDDLQLSKRTIEQIGATTKAAFDEGCVRHILLTGGFLKREVKNNGEVLDREGDRILSIIRVQQEALERDEIPVNVIRTAPEDLDTIAVQKEQGVYSVAYNLEIWEPLLFERYCRGKNNVQGRDHWLKALEVAAEVYGPGRVGTHFVAGFRESANSLLEGVEWMSERGIGSIPLVWSPVEGTPYAKERSPSADWYLDVTRKIAEIRLKYGVDTFDPASLPNDCHWCAMPNMIADELRLQRLKRDTEASESGLSKTGLSKTEPSKVEVSSPS